MWNNIATLNGAYVHKNDLLPDFKKPYTFELKGIITVILLLIGTVAWAQQDTVIMKQGDMLTGQMLSIDRSTLSFKTPYAADPISLTWDDVILLHTHKLFKLLNDKGHIIIGKINIDSADRKTIRVITKDSIILINRNRIDEISAFNKKLSERLKLSADLGFTATKENNTRQASLSVALKYLAQRWEFDFDLASYSTSVDSLSNGRAAVSLSARYLLPRNWFLIIQANSFTSTEQQIDYRVTYLLGSGKYLIRRNNENLYIFVGGTYNREKFTPVPATFKTGEMFAAIHFEFYPLEKLSISTDAVGYPSLTESGRLRTYSKTDLMFHFTRHFRCGLGYVLNTDNKPPVNSSKTDYIFNFKLGWVL